MSYCPIKLFKVKSRIKFPINLIHMYNDIIFISSYFLTIFFLSFNLIKYIAINKVNQMFLS